jgi:hypothetical protein
MVLSSIAASSVLEILELSLRGGFLETRWMRLQLYKESAVFARLFAPAHSTLCLNSSK